MFFHLSTVNLATEGTVKVNGIDVIHISSNSVGTFPNNRQSFRIKKNHSFRRNKKRLAKQGISMTKVSKG